MRSFERLGGRCKALSHGISSGQSPGSIIFQCEITGSVMLTSAKHTNPTKLVGTLGSYQISTSATGVGVTRCKASSCGVGEVQNT